MNIKKVLVVEDERMFREFLVGWLKREGYVVTGEASSLREAERMLDKGEPDLILLDMDLPDGDGMQFVDAVTRRHTTMRILVLTAHLGNYPVVRLRRSGVMGVLDKAEACGKELTRAFKEISDWHTYYSSRVERTFQQVIRESTAYYKTLSPREEELTKLFGLGLSNEKIARALELSVATVQGHRRNVMAKVGVKCTPDLIIWAIRNGFVNGPQIKRQEGPEVQPRPKPKSRRGPGAPSKREREAARKAAMMEERMQCNGLHEGGD